MSKQTSHSPKKDFGESQSDQMNRSHRSGQGKSGEQSHEGYGEKEKKSGERQHRDQEQSDRK